MNPKQYETDVFVFTLLGQTVAMTRAKRQLVVVCDSSTLNKSEIITPVVASSDGCITQGEGNSRNTRRRRRKRLARLAASKQSSSSTTVDPTFLKNWIAWLIEDSQVIDSKVAFPNETLLSLHEL